MLTFQLRFAAKLAASLDWQLFLIHCITSMTNSSELQRPQWPWLLATGNQKSLLPKRKSCQSDEAAGLAVKRSWGVSVFYSISFGFGSKNSIPKVPLSFISIYRLSQYSVRGIHHLSKAKWNNFRDCLSCTKTF